MELSSHSQLLQPSSLAMEGEEAVELEEEAQAFYAIYDGHCGVRAARYARVRKGLSARLGVENQGACKAHTSISSSNLPSQLTQPTNTHFL